MNSLTSMQRKMVYFAGILLLLWPTIRLGMPADASGSGGKLSELRRENGLGEANLGQVDPSSSTMNLVLLGFRGVAANLLWLDLLKQEEQKNWSEVKSHVESIVLLQPHFLKVWTHQGWNLSYNVSVEYDGVADRYYWVKEGAKFLIHGRDRNTIFPDLPFDVGRTVGQKIGSADEWRTFRKYFIQKDPDEATYKGEPDTDLNPLGRDNYLVAQDWHQEANDKEVYHKNAIMAQVLFRQYPGRCLMKYPDALQSEGTFGEITQIGWATAHDHWVNEYGKERFSTPIGDLSLDPTDEDLQGWATEYQLPVDDVKKGVDILQTISNYRYWRTRSEIEASPEMVNAHRAIYQGMDLYRQGKRDDREENGKIIPSEAEVKLEEGMNNFAELFKKHPELLDEDDTIDEVMLGLICWHYLHQINTRNVPENYPLKSLWTREQTRIPNLNNIFRSEFKVRD